ncbi:helix-turn-helix domain-containing protein [Flaviaesturariibacter aridisoli]|uniref:Helicase n=1 Tax=Flaviaesturariibacter aridisoli TaxID=2545761 RepID=A0A4R4DY83_9BACT|nr:helix-turn-helix domain-containing protein [Flaviaesturariibacter aridisoli]TCZ70501.1 helicase [Flaviaesturariibacter aridisoli]
MGTDMQAKDPSNTLFQLALDLVNHTTQHLFLTGKAGTGKTTFLRHVVQHTRKQTVVVAPTGVAAINAGGVTMHSFFQLPFGAYVPGSFHRTGQATSVEVTDRHSLFKNIRFGKDKREILEQLELLIIDEVSMMRCDMLDAIDAILRHFRRNNLPFGGVQVLYIGDLFQLPPVVQGEEWSILQQYYESPFFFSAQALKEAQPLYVELKKIYRQNEQVFIDILNRIRNNVATAQDLQALNERYQPQFEPREDQHYITITTHNRKADAINGAALQQLKGTLHTFSAEVKGDFNEKSLPTDKELQLKEGAQVMFVKNDPEKRYFNGKLATVKRIFKDEITVSFNDGSADLKLEKETWKNIKYTYDREADDINEEELGSFKQYPVRLAWAITVHKSQGLTFERAVIDAGASFAPGQVYVALSRCTALDGMVLRSRIYPNAIATDARVLAYAQNEPEEEALYTRLEQEKYQCWAADLLKLFDWHKLVYYIHEWVESVPEKKLPDVPATLVLGREMVLKAKLGAETARKYQMQLGRICEDMLRSGDTTALQERMEKAVAYFAGFIAEHLLQPLQAHIKDLSYNTRVKKYKEDLRTLEGFIWQQLQRLMTASYGELRFFHDFARYQSLNPAEAGPVKKEAKETKGKTEKGASQEITFDLFRAGKSIDEIATVRNLAISTVESHLAQFVRDGRLAITEVVEEEKVKNILKVMDEVGTESLGLIKNKLGDEYTFGEIRAVLNHRIFAQKISA